jgi:4'-phosphopantetheinyl transferase
LTADLVEVWLIRTDLPDRVVADLGTLLDTGEQARAAALASPVHRRRFIASHGAARVILGHRLAVPAWSLRWRYGPHGKPELAGNELEVSLSHSGDLTAFALTSRRRIGVDVQRVLSGLDVNRMAARYFPPAEARFVRAARMPALRADRFTRLWARKEARLKVTGGRLVPGMKQAVTGAGGANSGTALIRDLQVPPGFRGAVAAEDIASYRITCHWWPLNGHNSHRVQHSPLIAIRPNRDILREIQEPC